LSECDVLARNDADLETARAHKRATGNEDQFFSLVYDEQHAPAIAWFGDISLVSAIKAVIGLTPRLLRVRLDS
jgi:hypothetical protein